MKDYKLKIAGDNGITYWIDSKDWKIAQFKAGNIWKWNEKNQWYKNYLGEVYNEHIKSIPQITTGRVFFNDVESSNTKVCVNSDGSVELTFECNDETITVSHSYDNGSTYEVKSGSTVLTNGSGNIYSKSEEQLFMDECCYNHFPEIKQQQLILSVITTALRRK